MRFWLLALQVGGAAPLPLDFDLARLPAPECGGSGSDIVVCGRRKPPPRIAPLPDATYAEAPVRAELRLPGNLTGSARVDSRAMPDGTVSNRIMLGIKAPF